MNLPGNAKPETDGRALRTIRSRTRIIEAAFELYAEGVLVPTAQEIADRSGLGVRTVFRHFTEMEALCIEADKILYQRYADQPHVQPAGNFEERISQLVAERAKTWESFAPHLRATLVQYWRYQQLAKQYRKLCNDFRKQAYRFLPELDALPDSTVEAVNGILSFENWERLRTVNRRSQRAIRGILLEGLNTLLLKKK